MADVAARDGWQAQGALHHIIIRGIEQRNIFKDDKDRNRSGQALRPQPASY
ncbi:MAG: hypothetical protein P8X68_20250 [Desulfobacterales bacterium]